MTKKAPATVEDGTMVAVRLSKDQHRRMKAAAQREGLGISTWMRRLALAAIDEKRARG